MVGECKGQGYKVRQMAEKTAIRRSKSGGWGGVPPKNGFFLVGNGGVSELEGVSEGKVWLDALKCV